MNIENQLADLIGPLPEGITDGVALGTGLADGYDIFETAIGNVVVTFNPRGVSSVDIADEQFQSRFAGRFHRPLIRAEAPESWGRHIAAALEAGSPGKLPIDLRSVTPFQATVLKVTSTIPKGEVRPYSWLANEAERPRAVRAAGSAVARNPVPLIIPCHRVVRADGHLGQYSLGGVDNKADLLEHEGADPYWLEELASQHIRVRGNTSTKVYCHPTCRAIRRSKTSNVIDFHSVKEAEDSGFRACQICRPCC